MQNKLNNLRKSNIELFQVNYQAGILRMFLVAVIIFVLWSFLAAISASLNPLGSLDLPNILGINSENLALSLFVDILDSYFSIFSISLILLFLLIALLSFEIVTDYFSRIRSSISNRMSKNYLMSCAFSFPKRKKLLFPDDLIDSENILQGPLEAVIKPGYALLVKSKAGYSVKFNNSENSEIFEVSLSFREEIIHCFNLTTSSISFRKEDQKLGKSFLIEMVYGYYLPADNKNMAKFATMLSLFDSGNIRKIIESILISETRIAFNQYFRNSSEPSDYFLSHVQIKPTGKDDNSSKVLEQKKLPKVFNFFNSIKSQGVKRNRKRPIYLKPSSEVIPLSKNHEEVLFPSLKDQLNELLAINLQSTLLNLFGMSSIIKGKIINIQERGLN